MNRYSVGLAFTIDLDAHSGEDNVEETKLLLDTYDRLTEVSRELLAHGVTVSVNFTSLDDPTPTRRSRTKTPPIDF